MEPLRTTRVLDRVPSPRGVPAHRRRNRPKQAVDSRNAPLPRILRRRLKTVR
ncbi:hypothetical protein RB9673 [Rhodopirellula baltica SH 1]|uniref:Uncharacterized protein n=1 Tax=Rhodopirellula baltica (strain DSM 10527 / NCIMB 13988 / SH1) TaxID=243090 RepID=Q7UL78_RHOBA|nr:hypothetical protein RB9673 [Rhodopirellula baltica SH 1]